MDTYTIIAIVIGLIGLSLIILAQIVQVFAKKSIPTRSLNARLEQEIQQLAKASTSIGRLLNEIQSDVDTRLRETESLRAAIEKMDQELEEKQTLNSLTPEQTTVLKRLLKQRPYWVDVAINLVVGALFFILGQYLRP